MRGGDDDESGDGGISQGDVQEAGVKYARYMREHGLEVSDPQGGAGDQRGLLGGLDPEDPRVQKAMDKCRPAASTLTKAE